MGKEGPAEARRRRRPAAHRCSLLRQRSPAPWSWCWPGSRCRAAAGSRRWCRRRRLNRFRLRTRRRPPRWWRCGRSRACRLRAVGRVVRRRPGGSVPGPDGNETGVSSVKLAPLEQPPAHSPAPALEVYRGLPVAGGPPLTSAQRSIGGLVGGCCVPGQRAGRALGDRGAGVTAGAPGPLGAGDARRGAAIAGSADFAWRGRVRDGSARGVAQGHSGARAPPGEPARAAPHGRLAPDRPPCRSPAAPEQAELLVAFVPRVVLPTKQAVHLASDDRAVGTAEYVPLAQGAQAGRPEPG